MTFSPDGKILAAHQPRAGVRLFDPATNHEFATLPTTGIPWCFSPDSSLLVTAGEQQTLQVWDLRLIRAQLATMGLDWDLPAYSSPPQFAAAQALQVEVETGELQRKIDQLRQIISGLLSPRPASPRR